MCPVSYSIMNKSKNHRFDLRIHMVRMSIKDGIRATARAFKTTRNTVRKWHNRFNQDGPQALSDCSHAPLSCPHKTSRHLQDQVIAQRQRTPGFGAAVWCTRMVYSELVAGGRKKARIAIFWRKRVARGG